MKITKSYSNRFYFRSFCERIEHGYYQNFLTSFDYQINAKWINGIKAWGFQYGFAWGFQYGLKDMRLMI